ncbi:MAG: hypothetical protein KDB14_05470 [Planctomycetales bacterium]|nr:hypothetical protein [Planctomycetales bacterium]
MNQCPHGPDHLDCKLTCKYNHFEVGDLRIDSWELKCLDCGLRKTIAFRSDDEVVEASPEVCPFCRFCPAGPGKNVCL